MNIHKLYSWINLRGANPPPPRTPLQNSGGTVASPLPPPPHPTLAPLVEATLLSFSMLSSTNKMDSLASTVLQDRHSDRLTNLYSNV